MIALKNTIKVRYDTKSALNIARRVSDWDKLESYNRSSEENADDPYAIISKTENTSYVGIHNGQELHLRRKVIRDSLPIQRKISAPEEIFTLEVLIDGKEVYTTSQQQGELKKLFQRAKQLGSRVAISRYEVA